MRFAMFGQKKELPLLDKYLPEQVRQRVIARKTTANGPNTAELLRRGMEVLEGYEREQERADMARLSLGRIAQGFGSVNPEKVFRAVNEGQVDTLLVRENLDEAGAIVLSTHTILGEYAQESPYGGGDGRVSVAPLRDILVYETVRRNGRVQSLPPQPNGDSPAYGVLYRSRGGAEYTGN